MSYWLTCLPGLSEILVRELATLGLRGEVSGPAAVALEGGPPEALRACLWSRVAERVLVKLDQCAGQPPASLEAMAARFDASQHLAGAAALTVQADHLGKVPGDARVTASVFRRLINNPLPQPGRPDQGLCLRLQVTEDATSLFLDLTGEPLGKRGYRLAGGQAPVRETLAAAMAFVALEHQPDSTNLVDPFCGSGTLLLEAGQMGARIAPALARSSFSFQHWAGCPATLWDTLRQEAETARLPEPPFLLKGFDADERRIREAGENARRAGLEGAIHLERRELARLKGRDLGDKGLILTNPPWGERLEERGVASALHSGLARICASRAPGVPVVVLGSDVEVLDRLGATPELHMRLRNGPLTNFIRIVTPQRRSVPVPLTAAEPAFEVPDEATAFVNRLRKNARQLKRWREQEQVSAYRLYDRDLPDFNFSVDIYADQVLMQEYKAPKTVDPEMVEKRRHWAVSAVRSVLGAHREQVHLRTRMQQKGRSQYNKLGQRKQMHVVAEGEAWFLVNLQAYLDSGLFLDHRPIRLRLAQESAGKRFLNLFAYTGSATVHAALGGARSSVTVDASRTYLGWAGENLALNGFGTRHHRLERGDAMAWLEKCHEQFDLIFCDPPTFSNSKNRDDFTVQRDHERLIRLAMKRLEPGGVLYFSCNFRRFELAPALSEEFDVEDQSRGSVPPDFQRHQDVHHLFAIRHKGQA